MTATPYLAEIERDLAAYRHGRVGELVEPGEIPGSDATRDGPTLAGSNPAAPSNRFNGASAWARLEPATQAAIGAAALELVIARQGMDLSRDMQEEALFEAAETEAASHLEERALEHMLDVEAIPHDQVPGIPSLLGPVCRGCGRTEHDTCWTPPWESVSEWPEPDQCPACVADAPVQVRTAPAP